MHSYMRYKSALPEKWLPQFSSPLETAKTRVLRVATEVRDETSRSYFFSLDCRTTRREYLRNPRTLWIINVHSVHNRTRRRYVGQNKAFFISRKLRVATRRGAFSGRNTLTTMYVITELFVRKILGENVNENSARCFIAARTELFRYSVALSKLSKQCFCSCERFWREIENIYTRIYKFFMKKRKLCFLYIYYVILRAHNKLCRIRILGDCI